MNVSAEGWERLATAGAARSFDAGDVLLRQGDPAAYVLVLLAGRVKVLRTAPNGAVLILAIRGPGEILGDISVLGGGDRSATVVAIDSCETRAIPADRFLHLARSAGWETQLLIRAMGRIREGEAWRAEIAGLPAGPRLIQALLRFAASDPDASGPAASGPAASAVVTLGQAELGQATGLARSTVAAELARLRRLGLVATSHHGIVITDLRGLTAMAGPGHEGV
ncbi:MULTISPECIES: Crp/Fnr family transcriptional regulator [Thermomonosporaceae]|uniref:Crp/Fnr family transcriptional regulator n=1 Tax=Thermomonosporaceae TaxID=2012 RepID=UPI00255A7C16|nr:MULTISPECIES: Crp/Fnr family transcriptional regulator [Thermomonosporaceae]MDL4775790.1 Crp/Fnr family transcriptional regulator [Actinomadura xylanilytica]